MPPIVVVDACVLYPIRICDLFIRLHLEGIFTLRWSREIQNEWTRSLISERPGLEKKIRRRANSMEHAVDQWEISNYQHLEKGLNLPDSNDRHVLAAAIHAKANFLVTFNTKDFLVYVGKSSTEIMSPDEFLCQVFMDENLDAISKAINSAQESLRNPPKTLQEYLDGLMEVGLTKFASKSMVHFC